MRADHLRSGKRETFFGGWGEGEEKEKKLFLSKRQNLVEGEREGEKNIAQWTQSRERRTTGEVFFLSLSLDASLIATNILTRLFLVSLI